MHLSSLVLCCLLLSDLLTTFSVVLKNLPPEVRQAQEEKLAGLKKQQEIHTRLAAERKIFLRGRKIKFFGESSSLGYNLPWVREQSSFCLTEVVFHFSLFREKESRKENPTSRETAAYLICPGRKCRDS